VQIEPGDLEGRVALDEIRPAEYQSPSGEVVRRNEVPYDGFRPLATETGPPPKPADRPTVRPTAPNRNTNDRDVQPDEIPF
jgi:hypothetical protein